MRHKPYLDGWVAAGAWIENSNDSMPEWQPAYMTGKQYRRMAATAQLFATAPDLLEALEGMVEIVEMNGFGKAAMMDTARSAINKARGKQ